MVLYNITKKSQYVKIKKDIGGTNLTSIGQFWLSNIMNIRRIYVISDEFWKHTYEFCAIRWHTIPGHYCDAYVQCSDYMKYNKHFEYLLTLKNSKLYNLLPNNDIFACDDIIEPCLTPNDKWGQT
jgi:hypothetical protein